MPSVTDAQLKKSGIQTTKDGSAYIPSSVRADGSTRKEIRVRPGYRPPEDVETYKNRNATAWKSRGSGDVPGAESISHADGYSEERSKNAKRRAAARKMVSAGNGSTDGPFTAFTDHKLKVQSNMKSDWHNPDLLATNPTPTEPPAADEDEQGQKKIRTQLKKLRAVQELKDKKLAGEKLSHDQLVKLGKEEEILRDLKKLGYTLIEQGEKPGDEQSVDLTRGMHRLMTG